MRAPRGPWATAWSVLASPTTTWILLALVGISAAVGLVVDAPHPASTAAVQVPLALLPFSMVAWALSARDLWSGVLWALGLSVACVGALLSGSDEAVTTTGGLSLTETATRFDVRGQGTPVHLGGQLSGRLEGEAVALVLGVGNKKLAEASAPLDGREVGLGDRWSVRVRDVRNGDEPTLAKVRGRLRTNPAAEGGWEHTLRVGRSVVVSDQTRLTLLRVSRDYGRSLGPAAEVKLEWAGGEERAWFFVEHGELDAHTGTSNTKNSFKMKILCRG